MNTIDRLRIEYEDAKLRRELLQKQIDKFQSPTSAINKKVVNNLKVNFCKAIREETRLMVKVSRLVMLDFRMYNLTRRYTG